jgi:CRISPR system Cascade subunit CasD
MGTLLLRLVGPMQSWGVQSNFTHRDTGLEPSKSGVIGLVCAAMGRGRDKPIDNLAALRMGVRVDREGLMKYDYHTAQDVLKASGAGTKNTEVSYRYYLADAAFLVGLEGNDVGSLADIHQRLRNPVWFLCLGRKAFVPSEPVWISDGLKPDQDLETALRHYSRLRDKRSPFDDDRARLMIEDARRGDIARPDQPISFVKGHRQFTVRRLYADFCIPPSAQEGQ